MRPLLALFFIAIPIFSHSVETQSIEQDRFTVWHNNKRFIEYYGNDDGITVKNVLEWAKKAIKTRVDSIADIKAGKNSDEGIPNNHMMIAEIYRVTFYKLSEWGKYESLIYDVDREKEIEEKKRMAKNWPNCPIYNNPNDLDNLEGVFTNGRIEYKFNRNAKREFLENALSFLYILELEKAAWVIAKKSALIHGDKDIAEIADMGIEGANSMLDLIKSMEGI